MAIMRTVYCTRCRHTVQEARESGDYNSECNRCRAETAEYKRRKHFRELERLSIESRVRRIEEWIYNYKPSSSSDTVF